MDKPDWAELITRLIEERGYTEESIADHVETTQPTSLYLIS